MPQSPTLYRSVMISSTFIDLEEHRQALIKALNDHGLMHEAMENSSALADVDVLESSFNMVHRASAYILVIGRKYGQTPTCRERNPRKVSITELEFEEARRLGRPVLLFIMGEKHLLREEDVELDPEKRNKLVAFRERAKRAREDSSVNRVYSTFDSLDDFKGKVGPAVAKLKELLDTPTSDQLTQLTLIVFPEGPRPPQLYTNSPYLASHQFVGREEHLRTLDEWAQPNDPHSAFLFEAIGGSGKSILSWTWLQNQSDKIGVDWAGRFWYSFYERGAETRDFLMQALSYMTGQSYQQLKKKSFGELAEQLSRQLRAKPWLLILDGIERLLVSYNRFDAAYADDDTAGTEDRISKRDPLAMVREEDSDLFRSFLTAAPSKILITSRLTPRCLVNFSHQPLPGLHHQRLPGLRPEDAEIFFRSCGAYGDSHAIRSYLKENCDCHPLVIGFIAGLVKRYLPDRGNFDAWVKSPNGGLALNLAELDLIQRRNHILEAAINALSTDSRELLALVAMVLNGFDYRVLDALNQAQFDLEATVTDLEERGLLLFDKRRALYDLHPVVRRVVVGGLGVVERERFGERVIDYFSAAAATPLSEAETLEDVQSALNIVHTYLAMGKLEEAWKFFKSGLDDALWLNLEAYERILAILHPLFADHWINLSADLPDHDDFLVLNFAGIILASIDLHQEALCSYMTAIKINLKNNNWESVLANLRNVATSAADMEKLALVNRILSICIDFSGVICNDESLFLSYLRGMELANIVGNQHLSDEYWHKLDPMGRDWSLAGYRPGQAELARLRYQFYHDCLIEADLQAAEGIATSSRASRHVRRQLHQLRGEWLLKEKQYVLAACSLEKAAQMARFVGLRDAVAETQLALATTLRTVLGGYSPVIKELSVVNMGFY